MSLNKERFTIISAEPDSLKVYVKKIWQHRALIWVFAKRDLKVKYAQMWLGLGWTIGTPLISVVIYTLFFGVFLNLNTFEFPYVIYVLSGLFIWNVFSQLFTNISSSLIHNRDIITKMTFPKIIIPLSKISNVLLENGILFVVFCCLTLFSNVKFGWSLFLFPLAIVGIIFSGFSVGLLLAALSVKKRDVAMAAPTLIVMSIWLTPVFYPVSIIPIAYQKYIYLNPVAAFIDLLRWSFGLHDFNHFSFIGILVSLAMFCLAFFLFKRAEDFIVEYI
jgi:lipopolysaccharide transport system permease protein